ncbi:MAG TPA: glycerate kinase [Baekduia sp.]|uniref:glycerate kinase n=1 Tax=Baekduia sp. TaxID=2600305 RepID=UPI002D7670DC|nr:glycerate kinase [Baekduia sp.]HET6507962.1 glycerate kinase [Baekduia sp.]
MAHAPKLLLAAFDSFKGTFSAREVSAAVAAGARAAGLAARALPIADGGEGTMDALVAAGGGDVREARVEDPLGRAVDARFALLDGGATAVVETAQASGLGLVAPEERDAWAASTFGTGQLVAAAVAAGAEHVLVSVGGSATTDGGAGALAAIEAAGVRPRMTVLCDVTTPWEDAPRVYGPQKGADAIAVGRLERRHDDLADRLPNDPRGRPMTGAAGGLSGALWARFDATLVPGARFVLDRLGFDALLEDAALVVTGEGSLDEQTFAGKAVAEVTSRCAAHGIPCHALVGRSRLSPEGQRRLGLTGVETATTLAELRAAGEALARRYR